MFKFYSESAKYVCVCVCVCVDDCSGIAKSLQANTDIHLKFGHFRLLPLTGRLTGWLADWLTDLLAD
jgi:hypothetical protein